MSSRNLITNCSFHTFTLGVGTTGTPNNSFTAPQPSRSRPFSFSITRVQGSAHHKRTQVQESVFNISKLHREVKHSNKLEPLFDLQYPVQNHLLLLFPSSAFGRIMHFFFTWIWNSFSPGCVVNLTQKMSCTCGTYTLLSFLLFGLTYDYERIPYFPSSHHG